MLLQEDDASRYAVCVTDNKESGVEYRSHAVRVDVRRSLWGNGFEGSIDAVSNLTQLTLLYDLSHVVQSVIVVMRVVGK